MVNYQDTKIYYIQVGDQKYYGHTAEKYLSTREKGHRHKFKQGKTTKLYEAVREANMSADDMKCVWVEDYPCDSVNEAKARERYWIEQHGDLNMVVPVRTTEERQVFAFAYGLMYRETHREALQESKLMYREKHKDAIHERDRVYRETHLEAMKAYDRVYFETHKEAVKARHKQYYETHKEAIKQRRKVYLEKKKGN